SSALTTQFTGTAWKTVEGGFFTVDTSHSLASAISGATFNFYFESSTNSTVTYNGHTYVTQDVARSQNLLPAANWQGFVVNTTVANANFNGFAGVGVVTGLSMEIVSVPEPSTWVMGLMAAGVALARRRRLAGLLTRLRSSIPL
ncbi:MAG: PEP-CTERM sorting domain-containing protein, partial [Planctomycetia bacterium]